MAIKVFKKINEKDACSELIKKPQILNIQSISNIKPSKFDDMKYYFFINFIFEDGRKFSVSYIFDKENEHYTCKTRSKLFLLLKGFLEVDDECGGIGFTREDLIKLLVNKKFLATAEFREINNKSFPFIKVVNVID